MQGVQGSRDKAAAAANPLNTLAQWEMTKQAVKHDLQSQSVVVMQAVQGSREQTGRRKKTLPGEHAAAGEDAPLQEGGAWA